MSETRICPFCGRKAEYFIMYRGDTVGCQFCGIPKKQTNGDNIRKMSNEKLTKFLSGNCPGIFGGWLMHSDKCNGFDSCQECWMSWLKQEAQE